MDGQTSIMHITITGDLGSGKSTVAKLLASSLKYQYISTGNIQRQLASNLGMDTLQMNYYANNNAEVDIFIDNEVKKINESSQHYIVDSRMAWHFINKSFKIYLTVHSTVAAKRVLLDKKRQNEPLFSTLTGISNKLRERKSAEDTRFSEKYGVQCSDLNNYDLVLSTAQADIEDIVSFILVCFEYFKKDNLKYKRYASPYTLYPTESVRNLSGEWYNIMKAISKHNHDFIYQPIEVVEFNEYLYLWNGHKRTSIAIFSNRKFIPIKVINDGEQDYFNEINIHEYISSLNKSFIYDWEDFHNFKFELYPFINYESA